MTDHPVRSRRPTERSVSQPLGSAAAVGFIFIAVVSSGCAERRRPTLLWQTASIVHPRIPTAPKAGEEIAEEDVPELRLEAPVQLLNFPPGASSRPPRPRVVTPQPAAAEPSKPQTPFVAPQLSAQESTTAQQETTASLAEAEKSLADTQGKRLNAAQSDMVSKITGFMADARTAGASGDWTSAQTLARKAQLLSEELAKSLQ
jgi:hypothetical protein